MRYLILVKCRAEREARAGTEVRIDPAACVALAEYHQALAHAGVLLAGSAGRDGLRVRYDAQGRHIVDGSLAGPEEFIAGYVLIDVSFGEEAMEWSRRFPYRASEDKAVEIEMCELLQLQNFGLSESARAFP